MKVHPDSARPRRDGRKPRLTPEMKRVLRKLAGAIVVFGVVVASSVAAIAVPLSWLGNVGSGDPEPLTLDTLEQRSYVYAKDGSLMAGLRGEFNRQPIPLNEVPRHVVDAILAVEDAGFYAHDGVNGRAMVRALRANVEEGDVAQGGSTITQQLVKQSVLTDEQTLDRKVQEIVLALRLEREMSKDEILTLYLNTIYFGNSAYGIQAAAETYFGVSPAQLDVGQAAMLAALIRNPSNYNPVRHPERAKQRRRVALERMHDLRLIDEGQVDWFDATPVPSERHNPVPEPRDYFVDAVKQQLLDHPALGETEEAREAAVFTGGIKVYTTFDPRAQQLALDARNSQLPGGTGAFDIGVDPETGQMRQATAAIVTVEQATGAVRALVGGPGFDRYQYNLATQNPRQGGSSHKTFVLTALMEQGFSPGDMVDGTSPCHFVQENGRPYDVSNFDRDSGGIADLTEQTIRSVNCAYVRMGQIAGIENVVRVAHAMGIPDYRQLDAYPSFPLGAEEVTPLEMAGAYATLANDGVHNPPYLIERIEDASGRVLFQHAPAPRQGIQAQTARLVTQILQQNVTRGTGTGAALPGGRPAAGKTGTAQNSADAWFVGYTAQYTTAVWVGGMGGQVPIRIGGRGITGGAYPASIWRALMAPLHQDVPAAGFAAPGATRGPRFIEASRSFDPNGGRPAPPPPGPGPFPPGPGGPPITLPFPVPGGPGRGQQDFAGQPGLAAPLADLTAGITTTSAPP
jgi:penicillin-binding protein 1A